MPVEWVLAGLLKRAAAELRLPCCLRNLLLVERSLHKTLRMLSRMHSLNSLIFLSFQSSLFIMI